MIAAGCGPVVKLWAPADPQHAIKLNEGTPVYCLDFSHNNRVLSVAGEKGQANLYSGKGASVATGAAAVGNIPRAPDEGADSITCIKFAPNDSFLLGGCMNGLVHIWSLKEEDPYTVDRLSGSAITSVAVNASLTAMAASSASGQVVLCAYPTGVKIRTLLQKGRTRASCLNFGSNSTLLCGAKGSGQLLVWDVTQASQAEELNVHKRNVTGCMFVPNDDNLLVSCAEDGLLACTDRRTAATAWELRLHTPLHSVSMRWDGSMVAVGTDSGRVLVHDTRAMDNPLAAQEFSDELPVTALCWQHMPTSKSHKRNSLGATTAAAANPAAIRARGAQVSQGQAGAGPGSAVSAAAAAGGATSSAAGAAPAGARGSAGGASAQQPYKTPLVVPGWDSNTPRSQVTASTSSEPDYGMHVMSPMRMYSPLDSDINSAGPTGSTAAAAAAAAANSAGGALHMPDVAGLSLHSPADSAASGPGYKGPAMFTPGLGYTGGLAADITPVSRMAELSANAAAATSAGVGAATGFKGADSSHRSSAGGPNPVKASAAAAAAAPSKGADSAAPSAARGSKFSDGGDTAAASHRRKGSDSAPAVAPAAGGSGSRSRPSSAAGDSRNVQDTATADGSVVVVAAAKRGTAADTFAAGGSKAVGSGGLAVAGQQHIRNSSSGGQPAASSSAGAAAGGGVLAASGSALREDVFKAYVDKRMDALQEAVTNLQADLNQRFEHAQADLALVVNSLAARQDQLAEAITQLTAAVQSLAADKQQQQQQQQYPLAGACTIPWI